jgi:hypothetical protein
MSFFCPSPVCLERERQRLTGERRKKKKEKEIEKERETNIEVSSISRSEFLVPFLYNLTTTERTGCLSIWS